MKYYFTKLLQNTYSKIIHDMKYVSFIVNSESIMSILILILMIKICWLQIKRHYNHG